MIWKTDNLLKEPWFPYFLSNKYNDWEIPCLSLEKHVFTYLVKIRIMLEMIDNARKFLGREQLCFGAGLGLSLWMQTNLSGQVPHKKCSNRASAFLLCFKRFPIQNEIWSHVSRCFTGLALGSWRADHTAVVAAQSLLRAAKPAWKAGWSSQKHAPGCCS